MAFPALVLPNELLYAIVLEVPFDTESKPWLGAKLLWSSIEPLSLTSKACREYAMERWFEILRVDCDSDIEKTLQLFPKVRTWTKELHCFPKAGRDNTPWQLDKLIRLSAIRFFWTQWRKQPIEFVPDDFWKSPGLWPVGEKFLFPFRGARDRITSFEVIGSVDLHPAMAFSLAQTFPNLVELTIRSSRVWCGMCNNSEPVETAKSGPKHIKYQNSSGLPLKYHGALASLHKLQSVNFWVYNSGESETQDITMDGKLVWGGECRTCIFMRLPFPNPESIGEMNNNRMSSAMHRAPEGKALECLKHVEWHVVDERTAPDANVELDDDYYIFLDMDSPGSTEGSEGSGAEM